jgi:hypothetical protein
LNDYHPWPFSQIGHRSYTGWTVMREFYNTGDHQILTALSFYTYANTVHAIAAKRWCVVIELSGDAHHACVSFYNEFSNDLLNIIKVFYCHMAIN